MSVIKVNVILLYVVFYCLLCAYGVICFLFHVFSKLEFQLMWTNEAIIIINIIILIVY